MQSQQETQQMQDDPGDSNPDNGDSLISQEMHSGGSEPVLTRPEAEAVVETKTAPRVTEADLKAKIKHVRYAFLDHLTICVLELQNGFFVTGQSAPASPANFDADVGKRYSYDMAFRKIWELEGYALRNRLHEDRMADEANAAAHSSNGIE